MEKLEARWTVGKLKRLGNALRDGAEPSSGLPDYDEVMLFYNEAAVLVEEEIDRQDWGPILGELRPRVTSRAKSIDTLREKLQRIKTYQLPNIQDIAGVRFEADMSLDQQDQVAKLIAALLNPFGEIDDIRVAPHSGYRAIHVLLRLPTWDGDLRASLQVRVEVQIRTQLQSAWANMYEAVADVLGRGIRYDEYPAESEEAKLVAELQHLALDRITKLEHRRNEAERVNGMHRDSQRYLQTLMPGPKGERVAEDVRALGKRLESVMASVQVLQQSYLNEMQSIEHRFATMREERKR
jgi:ppGpp synthetase/RelA/SpoT-type nucleotidyltranferase